MKTIKKVLFMAAFIVLTIAFTGMGVSAANKTMKNKKWISGKGGAYVDTDNDGKVDEFESDGTSYYKISIPKQGYIVVDVKVSSLPKIEEYRKYLKDELNFDEPEEEDTSIQFLNSKKKELTGIDNYDGEKNMSFTTAVKKGTYFVAVRGNQKYKLRYSFTSVPKVSKAGKTMDEAVTLKKGTTIKRLFFVDGGAGYATYGDYYKIKLSQKKKVTLVCNSKIKNDDGWNGLKVQMYVKKGKTYRQINNKGKLYPKDSAYWYAVQGKDSITYTLPKGTYYLRMYSSQNSGYYTMKWK